MVDDVPVVGRKVTNLLADGQRRLGIDTVAESEQGVELAAGVRAGGSRLSELVTGNEVVHGVEAHRHAGRTGSGEAPETPRRCLLGPGTRDLIQKTDHMARSLLAKSQLGRQDAPPQLAETGTDLGGESPGLEAAAIAAGGNHVLRRMKGLILHQLEDEGGDVILVVEAMHADRGDQSPAQWRMRLRSRMLWL